MRLNYEDINTDLICDDLAFLGSWINVTSLQTLQYHLQLVRDLNWTGLTYFNRN